MATLSLRVLVAVGLAVSLLPGGGGRAIAVAAGSVAAVPTPTTAGAIAQYTITFGSGSVPSGGVITVAFPAGTGLPATIASAGVRVGFAVAAGAVPTQAERDAVLAAAVALSSVDPSPLVDVTGRTILVPVPALAPLGSGATRVGAVVLSQLSGITNPKIATSPAVPGSAYAVSVSLSWEPGPAPPATVSSAAYTITRAVTFSPNEAPPGAKVTVNGVGFTPGFAVDIRVGVVTTTVRPVAGPDGTFTGAFTASRSGAVNVLDGGDGLRTESGQPAFTLLPRGSVSPDSGYWFDEVAVSATLTPGNQVGVVTLSSVTPNANTVLRNQVSQFSVYVTTQSAGAAAAPQVGGCPIGCVVVITFPRDSAMGPGAGTAANYTVADVTAGGALVAPGAVAMSPQPPAPATAGPTLTVTTAGAVAAGNLLRITALIGTGISHAQGLYPVAATVDADGGGPGAPVSLPTVAQVNPVSDTTGAVAFYLRIPAVSTGEKALMVTQTVPPAPPSVAVLTPSGAPNAAIIPLRVRYELVGVSPASGVVGTQAAVSGSGFLPNAPLSVDFNGAVPAANLAPPTPRSDARGAFSFTMTIPGGLVAQYSPPEDKTLTVSDGTVTAFATFTIVPRTVTLAPTGGPPGTGVSVTGTGWPVGMAVGLTMDGVTVGRAMASASGAFAATFTVPTGTSPGARNVAATIPAGSVPRAGPALPAAISATATFTVPAARATVSPPMAAAGDRITISAQGLLGFAPVTVSIGGLDATPLPAPTTDGAGNVTITGVLVPLLDTGPTVVTVTAGSAANASLTIAAALARPARAVLSALMSPDPSKSILSVAWVQDVATGAFTYFAPGVQSTMTGVAPNVALFLNLTVPARLRISGREPVLVPAGGRWIVIGDTVTIEVGP